MKSIDYPIDADWSIDETIKVVEFLALVEEVYEKKVTVERYEQYYRRFKEVVTSISEEKRLDKEFQKLSNCSIYQTVQQFKQAKSTDLRYITIK